MGIKAKKTGGGNSGPNIDWDYITSQVEEDTHLGRVSMVLDLGEREQPQAVSTSKRAKMVFKDESDAEEALERAKEMVYSEDDADNLEYDWDAEAKRFVTNFQFVDREPAPEILIAVDLVDCPVEYIEGDESSIKPYRVYFYKTDYKTKDKSGYKLSLDYKTNFLYKQSAIYKFLERTGACKEIQQNMSSSGELDFTPVLGAPIAVEVKKNESKDGRVFIKTSIANTSKVPKAFRKTIGELPFDPKELAFDTVTAEDLMEVKPRGDLLKLCEEAINYDGSAMQEAIEGYFELLSAERSEEENDSDEPDDDEEEVEEKPKKKVSKKKTSDKKTSVKKPSKKKPAKEEKKPAKKASKEEVEEDDEDEMDDDLDI